jgi:hypothetical protein
LLDSKKTNSQSGTTPLAIPPQTCNNTIMNKTTADLRSISEFFTDAEWDAISSAMNDYADYGDSESEIANDIQSKIFHLFAATK